MVTAKAESKFKIISNKFLLALKSKYFKGKTYDYYLFSIIKYLQNSKKIINTTNIFNKCCYRF